MKKGSIAASLFLLSAAWLIVALAATAFLLTDLYSRALDTSLRTTLEFQIESLSDMVLTAGSPASESIRVSDPRFSRTGSGFYWSIRDASGALANFSDSQVGIVLAEPEGPWDESRTRSTVLTDPFGTRLRAVERAVTIADTPLTITVTGSLDEISALVDEFRGQTLIVLGAVAIMLAVMSTIVARFTLRPIGLLRGELERVREGEAHAIAGHYPSELAPLAEEIRELMRSNTEIIERARSQVGNLAHGLKTPLAVLRNEAAASADAPLARVVLAQTDKMTGFVSTYLERARAAARSAAVGRKTDVPKAMERLVRVMARLYPALSITLEPPVGPLPAFRGDEADFEEMAGNLIDNACKWASGAVRVTLSREPDQVLVLIEDDGPGLSPEDAEKALRRGVRLDEKTPGSGLGLDIVKELVDVYGGQLRLKRSALGGVLAQLSLPAARTAPHRNFAAMRKE